MIVVQGAGVLGVGNARSLRSHAALVDHGQSSRTKHDFALNTEIGVGLIAGVGGDNGSGVEVFNDVGEDLLRVVGRIATDDLGQQIQFLRTGFEQRDGAVVCVIVGRMGFFP